MRRPTRRLILAALVPALGGCGRKGDLELPKEEPKRARQPPQQTRSADSTTRQAQDLEPPPDA